MEFLVLLGVLLAGIVIIVALYNTLVRKRQMVEEGWSGIDVQLKRRANLIPNLVETVKKYTDYEAATLESITQLRTRAQDVAPDDVANRSSAEQALAKGLGQVIAVAESNPDLKASETYVELHRSLMEIEEALQMARRYYNGTVRDMNVAVESFPSNLIAQPFGFQKAVFFELDEEFDRSAPTIEL